MRATDDRCPRHPNFPLDRCDRCEAVFEEEQEADHDDERWQVGQDRYEKWLDEIGGSR